MYLLLSCQTLDIDSRRECLGPKEAHAQIGLPNKSRSIKGLVVCYVVWLWSMIYVMGLWTSATCVVWSLFVVILAIELNCRNIPEIYKFIKHKAYKNNQNCLFIDIISIIQMHELYSPLKRSIGHIGQFTIPCKALIFKNNSIIYMRLYL